MIQNSPDQSGPLIISMFKTACGYIQNGPPNKTNKTAHESSQNWNNRQTNIIWPFLIKLSAVLDVDVVGSAVRIFEISNRIE